MLLVVKLQLTTKLRSFVVNCKAIVYKITVVLINPQRQNTLTFTGKWF